MKNFKKKDLIDITKNIINNILELKMSLSEVFLSPCDMALLLEKAGLKRIINDNTGWDYEYYMVFKDKDDNEFVLRGSGYYGGHTFGQKSYLED